MAVVKGWNALIQSVVKQVDETVKKDVFPVVKEVYQKHIQAEVYDAYSPVTYQRRGSDGGLIDSDNIVGKYKDRVLEVRNIAKPNESIAQPKTPYSPAYDTQFAAWIERGKAYTGDAKKYLFGPRDHSDESWALPRPFTKETVKDLSVNQQHKKALCDGLKRRGLKVE